MQYNRQLRQASQEAQQRRALLQRLADRKQGSHVLLDSSDSDSSEDGFGADSPAASSASEVHVLDAYQSTNVVNNDLLGGRKVLKRLSQQKENLPQAAQNQSLPTSGSRQGVLSAPSHAVSDASETRLLDSMAGLAIKDSVDKPRHAATKLAAAVATKLPDDMPGPSATEASIQPLVKAGGSRTAKHDTVSSQAAQQRAVIIAPKTLLAHWEKELVTCGLGSLLFQYYGSSQADRDYSLRRVATQKGILLTTYGMVLHNSDALGFKRITKQSLWDADAKLCWDFMILDEGHKVKNPKMQLVQRLQEIPVAVNIIISGTPIQNNLMEMHALFDFACEGLLGDAKSFKLEFEKRITAGNDKNATGRDRQIATAKAAELRARIAPFFLRREKKDVLPSNDSEEQSGTASEGSSQQDHVAPKPQAMGHKNDLIVWLQLHPAQRHAFLESSAVRAALNKTGSALAALTVLKKICDHPTLLNERAASLVASAGGRLAKVQAEGSASEEEEEWYDAAEEVEAVPLQAGASWWEQDNVDATDVEAHLLKDIHQKGMDPGGSYHYVQRCMMKAGCSFVSNTHVNAGVDTSCKTAFVMSLLAELVAKGHRTLIFSQSRVMLDILQAAIVEHSYAFRRIDGSISSAAERQGLVQEFQTRDDIPVFLLTTQVGGLGLTLTAADRVIIVDPAWNPSVDNQSVDRAYRIGQQKDVVVYRLITCGTVEEKIYKKQVFKGGLSRSGTEEGVAFRYFSQQDLRDLFRVVPSELEGSETQHTLHQLHSHQRKATPYVLDHLHFLETLPRYAGVSDHDLMFSKKAEDSGMQRGEHWPEPLDSRQAARPPLQSAVRQRMANAAGNLHLLLYAAFVPHVCWWWAGSGDISDMLSRTLHIGGPTQPSAASSRGPFGKPAVDSSKGSLTSSARNSSIEEIQKTVFNLQKIAAAASSLPDGGAKLHSRIANLRKELAQLQGHDTPTTAEVNKLTPQPQHQSASETLPGMSAKSIQPSVAAARNHSSGLQPTVTPFIQAESANASAASTSGRSQSSSSSNKQLHHQALQSDGAVPQHGHDHQTQLVSTSSQDCNLDNRQHAASLQPASLSGMTSNSAASHVQSSGAHSIQGLTVQIKQMKIQMIQYAGLLDNPDWKLQQADGGKSVLTRAKLVRDKREALKVELQALQSSI
ncbi:MAG: hypothetical protein FRX49_00535 [Trebouxia sp. A1-2]|nr:MAG: hypothetical protein FRX49_00535 [Trebouxia sp. A1-2]